MTNVADILRGLTRGLDPAILDRGFGEMNGQAMSFYPKARALGVVLPSNSPGVHGLWIPTVALKTPLVLRPGGAEPWTPYRIVQAMMKAGMPADAFCYFPSDHAGAGEIVRQCGRSIFFGDAGAVGSFAGDPRIELHGPGYSKVLFGSDEADRVAAVAGPHRRTRSPTMAAARVSTRPASGRRATAAMIALALAERLARIEPRAADDPKPSIAPFADPRGREAALRSDRRGLDEPGPRTSPRSSARARDSSRRTAAPSCFRRSSTAHRRRIRSRTTSSCFRSCRLST